MALLDNHILTFSTFSDFTKQEGFLFGGSGFGVDPKSFLGKIETGGPTIRSELDLLSQIYW